MYTGFELCEARAAARPRGICWISEKYQIRAWDWDRPGNIVAEITALNRIRRRQSGAADAISASPSSPPRNDQVLFFEKATPDRDNVVLVAVSLDPHNAQEADIELPLWHWGLPDHGTLEAEDLLHGDALRLARQVPARCASTPRRALRDLARAARRMSARA